MSLVNDMLNDLEQRRASQPQRKENLDWLTGQAPRAKKNTLAYLKLLVLLAVLIAAAVIVQRYYSKARLMPAEVKNTIKEAVVVTDAAKQPQQILNALQSLQFKRIGDETRIVLHFTAQPSYHVRYENNLLKVTVRDVKASLSGDAAKPLAPFQGVSVIEQSEGLVIELPLVEPVSFRAQALTGDSRALALFVSPVQQKSVLATSKSTPAATAERPPQPLVKAVVENKTAATTVPKTQTSAVKKDQPLTLAQKDQRTAKKAAELIQRGQVQTAQQLLQGFTQEYPAAVRSSAMLVELLIAQQNLAAAQTLLNTLKPYISESSELRRLQAYSYVLQNQADEAVQLLLSSKPSLKDETAYYELLASAAQRAKQYPLSIQVYKNLLRYDASQGQWWLGLAISEELYGLKADARQNFLQVLKAGRISDALRDYAQNRYNALAGAVNSYPQSANESSHGG